MKKLLLAFVSLLYLNGTLTAAEPGPYQGLNATPALSLQDLGDTVHSLKDYRGQVVLVNFWASWCTPCMIEMPGIQRLQQALSGKPFTVLGVNVGESKTRVWKVASSLKVQFPVLLDRDGRTASDWQVDVYPSSFLIDPQGRIRHVVVGQRKWDDPDVIQTIEGLFSEEKDGSP